MSYIDLVRKQHLETAGLRRELRKLREQHRRLCRDVAQHISEKDKLARELIALKAKHGVQL